MIRLPEGYPESNNLHALCHGSEPCFYFSDCWNIGPEYTVAGGKFERPAKVYLTKFSAILWVDTCLPTRVSNPVNERHITRAKPHVWTSALHTCISMPSVWSQCIFPYHLHHTPKSARAQLIHIYYAMCRMILTKIYPRQGVCLKYYTFVSEIMMIWILRVLPYARSIAKLLDEWFGRIVIRYINKVLARMQITR